MVAGHLDQLGDQLVLDRREAVPVGRGEGHRELVGGEGPPRRDGAAQVHLPGEPAADLDRLQPAAEGPGEDALDQALEAALELLESHQR